MPQGRRVFPSLSVRENLEVAALGVGATAREARVRASELLEKLGLSAQAEAPAGHALGPLVVVGIVADANRWTPDKPYDGVLANSSLHHIVNLEGVFQGISDALVPSGVFVTSDTIGRNGHMRWPEALAIVHEHIDAADIPRRAALIAGIMLSV